MQPNRALARLIEFGPFLQCFITSHVRQATLVPHIRSSWLSVFLSEGRNVNWGEQGSSKLYLNLRYSLNEHMLGSMCSFKLPVSFILWTEWGSGSSKIWRCSVWQLGCDKYYQVLTQRLVLELTNHLEEQTGVFPLLFRQKENEMEGWWGWGGRSMFCLLMGEHWLWWGAVPESCLLIVVATSVSRDENKPPFYYQHKM